MSITARIQDDVKDAMRARDTERTTALRMLVASLQGEAKDQQRDLSEVEEVAVLARERKKRVEAAEGFEQGGAADRAAAERAQAAMVEQYLPAQLNDAEVGELVDAAVAESGATDVKGMGQVMKLLQPRIAGRADAGAVSKLVRTKLGVGS